MVQNSLRLVEFWWMPGKCRTVFNMLEISRRGFLQSARQRGVRGVRGVRGMRGTQKMMTTSSPPAKHLIHLSYENIYNSSVINLLFIYAITRAFPSEPPNVNPDSGTPPRVFYRPVLVLVSFWDLRTSWLNLFSNLLQSSSIKHQHQASAIILIQQ